MSATGDNTRKKRPGQPGQLIGVRLQPEQLARLDATRLDGESRPEAIRRLLEKAGC